WGALELLRQSATPGAARVPGAFVFPAATLSAEQAKWLNLLQNGRLGEQDPSADPGEWMTQLEWEQLLEASLEHDDNRNWFVLLHMGIMRMERFDEDGAEAAWQESIARAPSAWAFRNLAALASRRNQPQAALSFYAQAWDI